MSYSGGGAGYGGSGRGPPPRERGRGYGDPGGAASGPSSGGFGSSGQVRSTPPPEFLTAAKWKKGSEVSPRCVAPAPGVNARRIKSFITTIGRGSSAPTPEVLTAVKWKNAAAPGVNALKDQEFHNYDVSISPDITSKRFFRKVVSQLVTTYKTQLGNKIPAYDGKKSLYTAGPLLFSSKEFVVNFVEDDSGPLRQSESPQDAIQVFDVVIQSAAPANYVVIGRSYVSTSLGKGGLGSRLEDWRGYYQSLRPTQMDISARPFYEPILVTEFIVKFLNLQDSARPLSDLDHLKVKKAQRGTTVGTTYMVSPKKHKISNLSPENPDQGIFEGDDGSKKSVYENFFERYQIYLRYPYLPCTISGQGKRAVHIPLEIVKDNRYNKNQVVSEEFGMQVNEVATSIDARVLPVPMLQYHERGC